MPLSLWHAIAKINDAHQIIIFSPESPSSQIMKFGLMAGEQGPQIP
jgi:hypothetical protein